MTAREALATIVAAHLTGEGIETTIAGMIAAEAASRVEFDALGCAVGLGAVIADIRKRDRDIISFTPAPASKAASSTGSPLDREMRAANVADEAERMARAQDVRNAGNPWLKGAGFNITRQVVLEKADPQLAERFKAEAGA